MIFLKTIIGYSIVFVMKHQIDMKIFKLELIEVFEVIHSVIDFSRGPVAHGQ
jgi:hypothetical protein